MAGHTRGRSALRRLLVSAAACLGVVLAAELTTRVIEPALPEAPRWPDRATQVKALQMAELGCADVVFAGDSMARDDLDPWTFSSADPSGRTAYNAALDAATPSQLDRWLTERVLSELDPSTVVLAISSADLNEHSAAGTAALSAYESSVGGRPGLLGGLQRGLLDISALARNRDALRSPDELSAAVRDRLAGERAPRSTAEGVPGVIGRLGEGLSRRDRIDAGGAATRRFLTEQLLGDYEISRRETAALMTLIGHVRRAGSEPVLLVLPVTQDYVDRHTAGASDFQGFLDVMEEVAQATGTPLVDLHDSLPAPGYFADTHHLNGAGSRALTRLLVERLPEGPPSRCGDTP